MNHISGKLELIQWILINSYKKQHILSDYANITNVVKIANQTSWCQNISWEEKKEVISPATSGSKSASSAEADADETLGKRYTPETFASSHLLTLGREKRLTTFMVSPTI